MITRLSPAKVNLHLKVLRKRPDGYHDLATLMQRVSLYDDMSFTRRPDGVSLHCPDGTLPEDGANIVWRAAAALLAHVPDPGGMDITLKKRIPLAAGLGGGSSNAATTLLAVNELIGSPCNLQELLHIGATLGADVPFFIFGQTAWAFGIGDRLKAAPEVPRFWFVLVNPGFALSTKIVYEKLNFRLTNRSINYSIPRFCEAGDWAAGLYNDLEKVSIRLHPELADVKGHLLDLGAAGALMSGSGPTVFGLFATEDGAETAAAALKRTSPYSVFVARTL
jgi:4-diphosphocytidyl-2-C-methyl-D-erythritol kinase